MPIVPPAGEIQSEEMQSEIVGEQVRSIYRQGPVLLVGATAAASVITFFGYQENPDNKHFLWFGAVLITMALRLILFAFYRKHSNYSDAHELSAEGIRSGVFSAVHWGWCFAMASIVSGLVWASWPLIFHDIAATDYLLMVSALIAGMIAVLANSGSVYLPAFYSFAIPLCMPFVFYHLRSGEDVLIWTGWLLFMFFFVNLSLALRSNRQYRDLFETRIRNQALLEQLEQEKFNAEMAVEQKNSFIAAASHDLRQPMHALGLLIAALSRTGLSDKQTVIMSDMMNSSRTLNDHFNAILDISRLESDQVEINREVFELDDMLQGLVAEFANSLDEKPVKLSINNQFPAAKLHTDRLLFERVLRNLLSNAVRFTERGQIWFEVSEDQKNGLMLSVCDSGVGIAETELDSIFMEYRRGSGSQGGLGLGLSIVQKLCRLLGVSVDVSSRVASGTKFMLSLPECLVKIPSGYARGQCVVGADGLLAIDHWPLEASLNADCYGKNHAGVSAESAVMATEVASVQPVVLVVDDEPDILVASKHLLDSLGIGVVTAHDAQSALVVLAQLSVTPALVLCDYRLANAETGVDVIVLIRDWCDCEVPACIITGDTSTERLAAISECGLPLLHKPLSAEAVEQCLHAMLPSFAVDSVQQPRGLYKEVEQIDDGERYQGAKSDLHTKNTVLHIG